MKGGTYIAVSDKGQIIQAGNVGEPNIYPKASHELSVGSLWIPSSGTYTFTHIDEFGSLTLPTPKPEKPQPTETPTPTATPAPAPSVPNNATPGQAVGSLADQLMNDPSNVALAEQVVNTINSNKAIAVNKTTEQAVMGVIYNNPMQIGSKLNGNSFNVTMHANNKGIKVVPENVTVNSDRAAVSLHFADANNNIVQPKLSAIVTVTIKNHVMPVADYVLVGEGNRMIDNVKVTTSGKDTVISFWAPHFSTYAIVPRSAYVAPNAGNGAAGNASANTTSPIRATGVDMSIALAGVAVVGGAVAAKKQKLSNFTYRVSELNKSAIVSFEQNKEVFYQFFCCSK